MRSFLKKWFHNAAPARQPAWASLGLESLEERRLLAAAPLTFNLNAHPHGNNGVSDGARRGSASDGRHGHHR